MTEQSADQDCPNATEATLEADLCDTGETFNSAQAGACLDALESQTCADFMNGVQPAACDALCTTT